MALTRLLHGVTCSKDCSQSARRKKNLFLLFKKMMMSQNIIEKIVSLVSK